MLQAFQLCPYRICGQSAERINLLFHSWNNQVIGFFFFLWEEDKWAFSKFGGNGWERQNKTKLREWAKNRRNGYIMNWEGGEGKERNGEMHWFSRSQDKLMAWFSLVLLVLPKSWATISLFDKWERWERTCLCSLSFSLYLSSYLCFCHPPPNSYEGETQTY